MYDIANLKKLPALSAKAPVAWKTFVEFDGATRADGVIPKNTRN